MSKAKKNRKPEVRCSENEERRQFLSEEEKELAFLIRNRDLMDPTIRKVDSENGYVGKFVN
ncbi:hypothetical protein KMI_10g15800 [Encephalitozoon hellem]|nr:hypothetical protein KMI_10g15800 [Encephalitozoon hellem]